MKFAKSIRCPLLELESDCRCAECHQESERYVLIYRSRTKTLYPMCSACYQSKGSAIAKFLKSISNDNEHGCWEWQAGLLTDGYGWFSHPRVSEHRAHRAAWVLFRYPIPAGLGVLHRCDNPRCVNPDHLFLGDQLANAKDMHSKGRSNTKLTHATARLVKDDLHNIPRPNRQVIAAKYGVKYSTVADIDRGRTWADV